MGSTLVVVARVVALASALAGASVSHISPMSRTSNGAQARPAANLALAAHLRLARG